MSSRFWSALARRVTPYVPGEQPPRGSLLKLNTNESPYAPSPRVLEALRAVTGSDLRRYPDPTSQSLRSAAARHFALQPEQVFAGNGSDEILAHCFAALLNRDGGLLFPDITYSFYPVWSDLYGVDYREVPLREDLGVAAQDYDVNAAAVLLPNPNAPTGIALPLEAIREFLDAAPQRLLVVDEAYVDFGAESAVPLIDDYDNLLVIQTFSKSRALAGMRLGLALGHPELIEGLRRVKDSFNSYPVDCVAERVGVAALEDTEWFRSCCNRVIATRERLRRELEALGFEALPSSANFLFVRHPAHAGDALFVQLRERGIVLRRWDKARIRDYLRISIGTDEQSDRLLAAVREILGV